MSDDGQDGNEEESILRLFDSVCFSLGDQDAILLDGAEAVCYYEIQEASKSLASQLLHRYRPDYVLIECLGHAVAEAVSIIACIRIGVPFVPVNLEAGDSIAINSVVDALVSQRPATSNTSTESVHIAAICCCENDEDPLLGVLYQAEVHRVVFVDPLGNMKEQIRVPDLDPGRERRLSDELYVLFTSGTSSRQPKAVVGSHRSTFRRLKWWRDTFSPSPRVARRTRLAFVDGITEILSALVHPPSVLVALSRPDRLYSEGIHVLLEDLAPSQITLLPSQLWQLLMLVDTQTKFNSFVSLERIICSGEAFSVALWRQIESVLLPMLPSVEILNLYGQTESTGDAMYANLTEMSETSRVARGSVVAVGKPIRDDIIVTATLENEIVIVGNLAVRYLSESPSSSSSLLASSFTSFATGDVGFCEKGVWYVQGRMNDVEKINGVWTSPSETEAAVAEVFRVQHPMAASIVNGRVYLVSEQPITGFSRQAMREAGYGWNVIPHQVICQTLPVNHDSAARKLDRRELQRLIRQVTAAFPLDPDVNGESSNFEGCVLAALNVVDPRHDHVDLSRSFVELGGDSASAVALLYQFRRRGIVGNSSSITVFDILRASSLQELSDAVVGSRPLKRAKPNGMDTMQVVDFRPQKQPLRCSHRHAAVRFRGCVDASPVVSPNGNSLYVGCQGGVLQKICSENGAVEAHRHFIGWMIQADCIVTSSSLIVCLFQRHEDKGMAVSLSHDLSKTFWETTFRGQVVSTPMLVGDSELCIVIGGKAIAVVDVATGIQKCDAVLPETTNARPIPLNAGGPKCALVVGEHGSLVRVDWKQDDAKNQTLLVEVLDSIDGAAPVYKDALGSHGSSPVIVTGANGAVCKCGFETTSEVNQLTSFPLSPAERLGSIGWIIGSYDGFVYLWKDGGSFVKIHVGACVYAKPLTLPSATEEDSSFLVCTTAGDVVRVRFEERDDSLSIVDRYRVAGEIWSNPVMLGRARVAVGARDSKLHIFELYP